MLGFIAMTHLVVAIILSIAAYYLYKIFIKPYYLITYYRKQGTPMFFAPITGTFKSDFKNAEEKGDFYYTWNELAKQNPRPKAVGKNIESDAQLLLVDPEAIRQFFVNHDQYIKHPDLFGLSKELGRNGLVLAEGKIWKRHRKLISMAFHYELLKDMTPDIHHICDELLEKIKTKDLNNVNMMEEMKVITGEVIGSVFFGENLCKYQIQSKPMTTFLAELIARIGCEAFEPLYLLFGKNIVKLRLTARHRKLMDDIREFRHWCEDVVKQRMQELQTEYDQGVKSTKRRKNIVDLFFQQRISSPADCLSDEEIVDEYIAFFSDGMDTTGHFITMMSYYLLKNPEWQEKLMAEINPIFEDPSKVQLETLNKLDTLTACMKETLRLAPPVVTGMERIALHDHDLAGIKIKKGTVLMACHSANHLDPRFHDKPNNYSPDRWLNPSSKTLETIKTYPASFIPFSMGARTCIGQHLAMGETRIIISLFLRKFKYELVDKDYRLRFTQRFLREPLDDIKYKLTPTA